MHKLTKKILTNKGYTIFHTLACIHCRNSIKLLKNTDSTFKSYDINKMDGGFDTLLRKLNDDADITGFKYQGGVPIIFKNGKFFGGFLELSRDLEKVEQYVSYV